MPDEQSQSIDINAMFSKDADKIFSTALKISHLDLVSTHKSKLDNIDSWVVTDLLTNEYIEKVFKHIEG